MESLRLYLSGCEGLRDSAYATLAEKLPKSLRFLELEPSGNFGEAGLAALRQRLVELELVLRLDCSYTQVDDDVAADLIGSDSWSALCRWQPLLAPAAPVDRGPQTNVDAESPPALAPAPAKPAAPVQVEVEAVKPKTLPDAKFKEAVTHTSPASPVSPVSPVSPAPRRLSGAASKARPAATAAGTSQEWVALVKRAVHQLGHLHLIEEQLHDLKASGSFGVSRHAHQARRVALKYYYDCSGMQMEFSCLVVSNEFPPYLEECYMQRCSDRVSAQMLLAGAAAMCCWQARLARAASRCCCQVLLPSAAGKVPLAGAVGRCWCFGRVLAGAAGRCCQQVLLAGVGSFSDLDLHSTTRGQALGGAWAVAGKADQVVQEQQSEGTSISGGSRCDIDKQHIIMKGDLNMEASAGSVPILPSGIPMNFDQSSPSLYCKATTPETCIAAKRKQLAGA
ncbi:unnamed protein product [Cladocopium goreaui]|uniref:Uncharacterized protein n=1 Tax=Cladocopium goreaui TaxID=2562237 RepID=A0A9P1DA41_9DINO|nr:unnamed protein product [Cladocopium goreaui]